MRSAGIGARIALAMVALTAVVLLIIGVGVLRIGADAFAEVMMAAGDTAADAHAIIEKLVEWSNIARKQGLLGLESAVEQEPDQPPRDTAVSAMENAHDHFLPDIAPFGQADRMVLDAGLERDRVVGHVHAKERIAGGKTRCLERRCSGAHGAAAFECRRERRLDRRSHVYAQPRYAETIHARHDNGLA